MQSGLGIGLGLTIPWSFSLFLILAPNLPVFLVIRSSRLGSGTTIVLVRDLLRKDAPVDVSEAF
jgi:hypothetical protein